MAEESAPKTPQMDEKHSVAESSHDLAVSGPSRFDRKLQMKLDLHLLTPMLFLNFLSLMGRTNIGAAMVQKLPHDLKMDAMKVFISISIPLVPLILFEVPSNLLMRLLERKYNFSYMRYLSVMTALLGLVTLGQGFDKSYSALLATRFLVGIFDSGLIPGCVFVCSLYYPAVHLQWRVSMLMVANIAANIVSNILAFAIAHINSDNGYHGWRWIFIVEGCLTMAIGLICCYSNISRPETASFLNEEEKEIIATEVEARTTTVGVVAEWKIFFSNILNYVWAACYVLTCATTYSVAIFAPSFVQAFHPHYTVPQVQGQVVPIFIVSAVTCLLAAWAADRTNHRASFAIVGYLVTAIGFIILRQPKDLQPHISMLGLYFVSMGTFASLPMLWSLTLINSSTPFQRAIGCGFVVGIGNVGGFVSAWLFRTSQAPHYRDGMTDSLIMTLVCVALIAFAWVYIIIANKKADKNGGSMDSGSSLGGDGAKVRKYTA
ncbi:major facilitator superfamily transporter protein [Rutstroemia sp. NJR-2017a WRK4]|nr:major facilitator superfamily transporter protein [Rutstroemia sp. NJR-2017a WRK4]